MTMSRERRYLATAVKRGGEAAAVARSLLRPVVQLGEQIAASAFKVVHAIWLGQEPSRRADISARGLDGLDARCEQDLDPWPVYPDPSQQFEAVEARHQDVGEDDIDGLGPLQDLDGLFAIERHQDLHSHIPQMVADRGGDERLVIDPEDGRGGQATRPLGSLYVHREGTPRRLRLIDRELGAEQICSLAMSSRVNLHAWWRPRVSAPGP